MDSISAGIPYTDQARFPLLRVSNEAGLKLTFLYPSTIGIFPELAFLFDFIT
jgi:hypothetical protein